MNDNLNIGGLQVPASVQNERLAFLNPCTCNYALRLTKAGGLGLMVASCAHI